ncbi:MAG: hypothetical protein LBK53_04220 [Heliobacteriaceae bacterium]|jgi:predicted Zn-dependent protease|nr:hypothetical protein [Heliobacteriaceae bacterium]
MTKSRKFTITLVVLTIMLFIAVRVLPAFFYSAGRSALKKEDYKSAYSNLKKAYYINPTNKDYRYYFVKSLIHMTPTLEVQKEIFRIAYCDLDDSAAALALNTVNNWKDSLISGIGNNYIEQTPFNKGILRWDKKSFPLKIHVETDKKISVPAYYEDEVYKAFSQWQSSVDFMSFTRTNKKKEARILVKICPIPKGLCVGKVCKYIVGFTTPTIKLNRLERMTIVLYSANPAGNYFSDKEFYNTALHEIGHSLGIMGHSYSSDDLMYMASANNQVYTPYRSSFQSFSARDVNTVRLLYKLIPDITNIPVENIDTKGLIYAPIIIGSSKDINKRKIKEALNYIKNAPNMAGGYIDLGSAYAQDEKYQQALDTYRRAVKYARTNDEKYIIHYNAAAIYLSKNDFKTALRHAQKAREIEDNEEINDLISSINHANKLRKFFWNRIRF